MDDELKVLDIYRGYKTALTVSTDEQDADLSVLDAVIYFPWNKSKFTGTSSFDAENNEVTFQWSAELTAKMPAGTGNIEFYVGDELYETRSNFVSVHKAAPADGTNS